jgi:carbonic anhydrase
VPEQSPVDLNDSVETKLPELVLDYGPSTLELLDESLQVRTARYPPNAIQFRGHWFTLQQFHMHAPAEHTIGGHAAAVEIHLVHEGTDGECVVVGVLVEQGESNQAFTDLQRLLEGPRGDDVTTGEAAFDPDRLLPEDRTHYRYEGSLTTPPYTEGVHWIVFAKPIEASAFQLVQLTRRFGLPAREEQPLDGRVIRVSS